MKLRRVDFRFFEIKKIKMRSCQMARMALNEQSDTKQQQKSLITLNSHFKQHNEPPISKPQDIPQRFKEGESRERQRGRWSEEGMEEVGGGGGGGGGSGRKVTENSRKK